MCRARKNSKKNFTLFYLYFAMKHLLNTLIGNINILKKNVARAKIFYKSLSQFYLKLVTKYIFITLFDILKFS